MSREVWEVSGEPGLLLIAGELPGSQGSGEVMGGLSRSSGEPDSLPATCQMCFQYDIAWSASTRGA